LRSFYIENLIVYETRLSEVQLFSNSEPRWGRIAIIGPGGRRIADIGLVYGFRWRG
jgi:hypothetical protein